MQSAENRERDSLWVSIGMQSHRLLVVLNPLFRSVSVACLGCRTSAPAAGLHGRLLSPISGLPGRSAQQITIIGRSAFELTDATNPNIVVGQ